MGIAGTSGLISWHVIYGWATNLFSATIRVDPSELTKGRQGRWGQNSLSPLLVESRSLGELVANSISRTVICNQPNLERLFCLGVSFSQSRQQPG